MQQGWDDIDDMILGSAENIEIDKDYNNKLLSRIHGVKKNSDQSYIAAFSLIMAGFLAIFIYTSDIQYKLAEVKAIARIQILSAEYSYDRFDILKYFIGE